jgi:hypothetical protein
MGSIESSFYSSLSLQQRFSVNVWAGSIDYYIIRLYVLENRFNGEHYANFLEEMLPCLLENVHLHVFESRWF